jgi:hypothetical protein
VLVADGQHDMIVNFIGNGGDILLFGDVDVTVSAGLIITVDDTFAVGAGFDIAAATEAAVAAFAATENTATPATHLDEDIILAGDNYFVLSINDAGDITAANYGTVDIM